MQNSVSDYKAGEYLHTKGKVMKLAYLANTLTDSFAFQRQEIDLVFRTLEKMRNTMSQEELDSMLRILNEKQQEIKKVIDLLPGLCEVMKKTYSSTEIKLKVYTEQN